VAALKAAKGDMMTATVSNSYKKAEKPSCWDIKPHQDRYFGGEYDDLEDHASDGAEPLAVSTFL
jgi:hypothetical protein